MLRFWPVSRRFGDPAGPGWGQWLSSAQDSPVWRHGEKAPAGRIEPASLLLSPGLVPEDPMKRLALLLAFLLAVGAARAEAITVGEIIELSKKGLSEDVLLALIEIESKVFPVDPETVQALKAGGVSERVIAAMVRHGRSKPLEPPPVLPPAPEPLPPPQPQVVVIDHHDHEPVVREVAVPVPVYVPVYVRASRRGDRRVAQPVVATGVAIGLPHSRIGLSAPPPPPTSDPPGWKKSPYLK